MPEPTLEDLFVQKLRNLHTLRRLMQSERGLLSASDPLRLANLTAQRSIVMDELNRLDCEILRRWGRPPHPADLPIHLAHIQQGISALLSQISELSATNEALALALNEFRTG